MKNRRSNWQIVVSGILIFAVWFGALPVYAQTKQDGKGVGVKVVFELPSKEKRWALIVGIDEYQNDVSTLKGSVNDAKALKNVLVNNAGFPENQVVLLTTDSADADKRPTRENILGALSDLYSRVPEDGLLLFSFSGHGISVGNQAFLIPSNGRFTKNPELLQDFSIDVSRIKRAIETMKVKQVLMLLDACRNEPGKGDVPNRLTDAYKNGFSFDVANSDVKAFATLYATSIGERAYEFYDKDTGQFRGYFSQAVEEALKGKAANEKGEVTLSRLIDYLETTVPKKVKYDKGENQIPTASYSETYRANQLILAVVKPGVSVFAIQQPTPSSSQNTSTNRISVTGKMSEADFWNSIKNSPDARDFENYLLRIRNGEFTGLFKGTAELKLSQFKNNDENIKDDFAAVTGGTFMMGTRGLQRTVSTFYIARHKVTQTLWQSVTGYNPSYLKDCNACPVENVSWSQIQEFLKTLNAKRDGWGYRLPTEIEWEYAARAGSALSSVQDLEANAWYQKNSGGKTHPVGEKKPNKWGLYDIYGNAMEWTADEFDPAGDNTLRVVRGCSFADDSGKCTPSRREGLPFDSQRSTIGFRIVKYPSSVFDKKKKSGRS